MKRDRFMCYFAYAFAINGIFYGLLMFQPVLPIFIAYTLTNLVNFVLYVFLSGAIRCAFDIKPFKNSVLYLTIFSTVLMFIFSSIVYDYNIRVLIATSTIYYYFFDVIRDVRKQPNRLQQNVKNITELFIGVNLLIWLVRTGFVLVAQIMLKIEVNNSYMSDIYLILTIVSMSLWFSLSMWLDAKRSIQMLDDKNEELSRLALIDKLTDLANRHTFEYDIDFLIAGSGRNKSSLSMIMIDLDRFKLVNDTHGHLVGDMVLKRAAEIIKSSVRTSDRVYRWGGEEFLVVMPDMDHTNVGKLAEKMCLNFQNAVFDVVGTVTVSIGGAEYELNESIETWLKRVDLSLYKAKQSGRNRHEIWIVDEELPISFNRVQWGTQLESGNRDIDSDHRELVNQINHLHDLIVNQQPIDLIRSFLFDITNHIKNHFIKEESILIRLSYSDYMEHRSIHHRILNEYEILVGKALNGDITLAALMSYLVEKVVYVHIQEEDSKFFDVVR